MDVASWTVRSDEGAGGGQLTPALALLSAETQTAGPALLSDPPAGPRHHRGLGILASSLRSVRTFYRSPALQLIKL